MTRQTDFRNFRDEVANVLEACALVLVSRARWEFKVAEVASSLGLPEPSVRRSLLALTRQDPAFVQVKSWDYARQTWAVTYSFRPSRGLADEYPGAVLVGRRLALLYPVAPRVKPCPACGKFVGLQHQCCTRSGCSATATGDVEVRRVFGVRLLDQDGGVVVAQPRCRCCRSNKAENGRGARAVRPGQIDLELEADTFRLAA